MRLALAACLVSLAPAIYGQVNVLTFHNATSRIGVNNAEKILTLANVNSSSFGKLFIISTDGKVDAQPLYMSSLTVGTQGTHNVLFVVTEHDSVYAFDADTGATLWHVSVLPSGETPSDNRGCLGQVSPEIGITSTPVIGPTVGTHGTIFVVAMSKNTSGTYFQRLHALDITTGAEEFAGPVTIQAQFPGTGDNSVNGHVVFDPKQYKDRASLLLTKGVVYTTWSSHCDNRPYTGWVISYSATTLKRVSVLNLTPNGNDGAIWGSGAGPAADLQGNLYWLEANGTFDTTLNGSGFPSQGDFGNSFIKASPTGGLHVLDYFAMKDAASENAADLDLGSGGLILLPPLLDKQGVSHNLAVGAGKDQNIYVVDTANMGKFNPNANNVYQEIAGAMGGATPAGAYSTPAFFANRLYYGGSNDFLKSFQFSGGQFSTTPVSQTSMIFPYPGATPSISSNGLSNGIVWVLVNAPHSTPPGPAVLRAFDSTDLSKELYDSNQAPNKRDNFGNGNKFIVPTIANGKVYVGTPKGVAVFGLLH
jgi:hypothetical protein